MNDTEFMLAEMRGKEKEDRSDEEILKRIQGLTKSLSQKYDEAYTKLMSALEQNKDRFKAMQEACEKLNLYGDIAKFKELIIRYDNNEGRFIILQKIVNDKEMTVAEISTDSQYACPAYKMGVSYNIAIMRYNYLTENIRWLIHSSLMAIEDRFEAIARLYGS